MPARGDQRVTPLALVCPAYKKEGPKAAASNILSVDLVVNPDASEGANPDLGAGVDGEVDVLGAEGVRARVSRERARLRLVKRAARRRVRRGRLRDVVVLERHGEDLRGGGRVHLALAKHPRLGLRGGDDDGGGLARLRKLPGRAATV